MYVTVHRKNRKPWVFRWLEGHLFPDANCGDGYYFFTNRGTTYRLFMGEKYKPFWIGRYVADANTWVTWEAELRAVRVECDEFTMHLT